MFGKNKISVLFHNKTVRNGGLFSIFSFFNKGVAFLLMTVLARYITPNQYGELSLFSTCLMFFGYIMGLSTAGYLSIAYFKSNREEFKKDFTSICIITVLVSLIIALIFFTFKSLLSELLKIPVLLMFMGMAISFFQVFIYLYFDYLRIQEKILKYGFLSCSFALMMCLLAIFFVVEARSGWVGKVYADLITCIVFGLITLIYFIRERIFDFNIDWKRCKVIILWGLPIIPHLSSAWIKSGLDRYIIEYYFSMEDVGIFSFAMGLNSIMIMVGAAFNQTNSVNLYQTLSSNLPKEIKLQSLRRKEKYFSLIYLFVAILVAVFGAFCVPILMPNYTASIPYFIILIIYGFFKCVYYLYCNYFFYYNKTKNMMCITFGSSIFHLTLSLLLTKYNLLFTCIIYIISEVFICAFTYIMSQKYINEYLKLQK